MGEIIWNRRSSKEVGLVLASEPDYDIASPAISSQHVIGRNGDVITGVYDFSNSSRTYNFTFPLLGRSLDSRASEIIEWLCYGYMNEGAFGYKELFDSYSPDIYYLATYVPGGVITKLWGNNEEAGAISVTFNRRPERFLISGSTNDPITIPTSSQAYLRYNNPTEFASYPTIKILAPSNSSNVQITFDHYGATRFAKYRYKMIINNPSTESDYIRIDGLNHTVTCDNEQVTWQILAHAPVPWDTELLPDNEYVPGEIMFWPGPNTIMSNVSGITGFCTPNWWRL